MRNISEFTAKEMLFDYLTNQLDAESRARVEEQINSNSNVLKDYQRLEYGINYCNEVSKTLVTEPLLEKIKGTSGYFSTIYQLFHYSKWPHGVKWTVQALLVAGLILVVTSQVPWYRLYENMDKEGGVILAEIAKPTPTVIAEKNVVPPVDQSAKTDSEKKEVEITKALAPMSSQKIEPSPLPQGYVYRAYYVSHNAEKDSEDLKKIIISLEGQKAGEVELGWKKPGSYYFHFTLKQTMYQEFQKQTENLPGLKFVKQKHSRIMPEGVMRFILTVQEK